MVSPVFSALNKHLEGDLSQWLEACCRSPSPFHPPSFHTTSACLHYRRIKRALLPAPLPAQNLEANRSRWSSEAAAVLETSKDFEDDGEVPTFVPGLPHVIRGAVDMAGEAEKDRKGKEKHAEEEAGAAPE